MHEREAVDARARSVHEAKAIDPRRAIEARRRREIDEHAIPAEADEAILRAELVTQAAVFGEAFILNEQRHVGLAEIEIQRTLERNLFGVFDQ
jgi:hypothetical protein